MPGMIRRRWMLIALTAVVSVAIGLGAFWRAAMQNSRATPDEPFRIAGNLYYVGAAGVTSFLLTDPMGDVLIDGGYPETAPTIMASLAKIGVDIHDVKVLLNTHAHFDHAGGLRALQNASGAELWISDRDADIVASGGAHDPTPGPQRYLGFLGLGRFPPPRIDHRFDDGTIIRLGSIALTAHVTAGHTPGCTSWSFLVRDDHRDLLAVDVCSLTLLPSVSLVDPETYPGVRSDFEHSFSTLRSLPADIFLGSHSSWFNIHAKRRAQLDAPDGPNPFIDPQGYRDYIDDAERTFRDVLAEQQRRH